MKFIPLKDADFKLVEIYGRYPHCKKHGAMNKLTANGIWRCVSTYKVIDQFTDHIIENNCKAGCQEE